MKLRLHMVKEIEDRICDHLRKAVITKWVQARRKPKLLSLSKLLHYAILACANFLHKPLESGGQNCILIEKVADLSVALNSKTLSNALRITNDFNELLVFRLVRKALLQKAGVAILIKWSHAQNFLSNCKRFRVFSRLL